MKFDCCNWSLVSHNPWGSGPLRVWHENKVINQSVNQIIHIPANVHVHQLRLVLLISAFPARKNKYVCTKTVHFTLKQESTSFTCCTVYSVAFVNVWVNADEDPVRSCWTRRRVILLGLRRFIMLQFVMFFQAVEGVSCAELTRI